MHPRVESFPTPRPDYRRFLAAVRRQGAGAVPLIELALDPEVVAALLEEALPATDEEAGRRALAEQTVRLLYRLGYDVVKMSAPMPFEIRRLGAEDTAPLSRGQRQWQDQHHGCITSLDDLARFRRPAGSEADFAAFEAACRMLPDGMALLGFCGGVLELTCDLLGLEQFLYAVYDAPELVAAVIDHVGQTVYEVFEIYCQMEACCALWLGDDLGSKNGLLVSPDWLRQHVFPWYRRYVELAHRQGRPFLLHSCGNISAVLPDLIDEVGIDAKHSFEDAILPVEQFIDRWGDKVGTLGGIDVDLLARGPEQAVVARTRQVLEHAAPRRGYACGSGNSITNYVPPDNYLAMVETVARFNGRR
ncbi:MAG: uroporphyrinogen decarboxylase family protein [Planctomycetota bacterium]